MVAALDAAQLRASPLGAAARAPYLRRRREIEERQLVANIAFDDGVRRAEEQQGRISGSLAWRQSRDEVGASLLAAGGGASSAVPATESRLLSSRCTLPPLASTASNAGVASSGWELLCKDAFPGPPEEQPVLFTGWGALLLAGSHTGLLHWRPLVPATPGPPQWKTIAIEARTPAVWPPLQQRLVGLAADPYSDRVLVVFTGPPPEGSHGSLRGSLRGAHVGERRSPTPGTVWVVRPERAAGASGASRMRWVASPLCAIPLPAGGAHAKVPLAVAGGRLCFLCEGQLLLCEFALAELEARAAAAACAESDSFPALPAPVWRHVCSAPGISALASSKAGLLLGYREAVDGTAAAPGAPAVAAVDGAVVILTRLPHAGGEGCLSMGASAAAAQSLPLPLPDIALTGPTIIPLSDRSAIDPTPGEARMRPSAAVAFNLRVAGSSSAAEARGRRDWLAFVGVGLLSESAALRAIEFAALEEPPGLALDATPSSSDDCIPVPTRALPAAPGIYELRHYRGPGWGGLASTSGIVVVASSAPAVDGGWTWIELCPATNLTGLGVGFVSAPAGGTATSVVLALSSSRELWGLDLPRSLIAVAEHQLQAAVPSRYTATIVASAAWNPSAAPTEVSPGTTAIEPHAAACAPVSTVPVEVPADSCVEPRSDSCAAASGIATAASVSTAVAARTSSDMKHRLALLFKQLTAGHGRPEACRHPLCASNPSNTRLSATAAATRALHLLSSGASDDDLVCRAASE